MGTDAAANDLKRVSNDLSGSTFHATSIGGWWNEFKMPQLWQFFAILLKKNVECPVNDQDRPLVATEGEVTTTMLLLFHLVECEQSFTAKPMENIVDVGLLRL